MTVINNLPNNQMGSKEIYDKHNDVNIPLPENLNIYSRKENTWVGGADNGSTFLLIERIHYSGDGIPTILADGDLDLYICSDGEIEQIGAQITGVKATGLLVSQPLFGYLSMLRIMGKMAYLVLTATAVLEEKVNMKSLSLDITARIFQHFQK